MVGNRTALITAGWLLALAACSEEQRPESGPRPTGGDAAAGDAPPEPMDGGSTEDAATPEAGGMDAAGEDTGGGGGMSLSGRVSYDWVEALDDFTEGGARLDYANLRARPARRVVVEAINPTSQAVLATSVTRDDGSYRLELSTRTAARVRVRAQLRAQRAAADGIPPDACAGASYLVHVVDNTSGYAEYVLDGATTYQDSASGVDLHAALVYQNGYRQRAAAPFALLDSFLAEVELICGATPDVQLPVLKINWSPNNVPEGDDIESGMIGTSYYDQVNGESNLYIVGQAEVDSDEYDDHIIAHELGHYFEDRLYRSDSEGGSHQDFDVLDPTVAFGEGFGNAISGMTFNDPIYVDTSGAMQVGGFSFDVSAPPAGDDRGLYSETSGQYLLWQLFERRDAQPRSGRFDRLHQILRDHQRVSDARTTLLTFAAYYNQVFGGSAEGLQNLWEDELATPYHALCAGICAGGGDTADPWDLDNDVGQHYASGGAGARRYPQVTGPAFGAEFWRLYKRLTDGGNTPDGHDVTRFGGYEDSSNKWGAVRAYRYQGSGMRTVSISALGASSCSEDVTDLAVYGAGVELDSNYDLDGCPSVRFQARQGRSYIILVYGLTTELPSYTINVGP